MLICGGIHYIRSDLLKTYKIPPPQKKKSPSSEMKAGRDPTLAIKKQTVPFYLNNTHPPPLLDIENYLDLSNFCFRPCHIGCVSAQCSNWEIHMCN